MNRREKFDKIYLENVWGYKSGPGSDPDFAKRWIDTVNYFLSQEDIKTVIDVGCGDWRIGKNLNLEGIDYTGVEVSSVIFKETVLNSADNIKFINADFQTLDIHDADLIIIKDVLQHLSNSSIYIMINKIMEKSRYALFCDDMLEENNLEDCDGGYRGIDISESPFNFDVKVVGSFDNKVIRLYVRGGEKDVTVPK
jgi:predicted TPR repeat methyltransferase